MTYNAPYYTLALFLAWSHSYSQDTLTLTLYFDTDHYQLRQDHQDQITTFLDLNFSEDSIASVFIQGYADRRGSKSYNSLLSERRVQSINEYLLSTYRSRFQKTRSQALGSTLAGHDLNHDRRVDITFYRENPQHTDYNTAIEIDDLSLVNANFLVKGANLKIKNLNFQPGRSKLLKTSIPQLKAIEKLLIDHPNISIQISGHVCCTNRFEDGRDLDNNQKNLSELRAKNIYDYLIRKGIDKSRLSYIGYGHSRPLVDPEITEEDRISNRRVEILITKS